MAGLCISARLLVSGAVNRSMQFTWLLCFAKGIGRTELAYQIRLRLNLHCHCLKLIMTIAFQDSADPFRTQCTYFTFKLPMNFWEVVIDEVEADCKNN